MERGLVRVLPDGVEISRASRVMVFRWEDVRRVAAWQEDLFAVDRVCLGFALAADPEKFIAVNEDMGGWKELVEATNRQFGLDTEWRLRVMSSAFEENFEVLWPRGGESEGGLHDVRVRW